jgi:hypothetical protein
MAEFGDISYVSVAEALKKAQTYQAPAAILAFVSFFGGGAITISFFSTHPAGIGLPFGLALFSFWAYRRWATNNWAKWAFGAVENVSELRDAAIAERILSPNDAFLKNLDAAVHNRKPLYTHAAKGYSKTNSTSIPENVISESGTPDYEALSEKFLAAAATEAEQLPEVTSYFLDKKSVITNTILVSVLACPFSVMFANFWLRIPPLYTFIGYLVIVPIYVYNYIKKISAITEPSLILSYEGIKFDDAGFCGWNNVSGIEVVQTKGGTLLTYLANGKKITVSKRLLDGIPSSIMHKMHLYQNRYFNLQQHGKDPL